MGKPARTNPALVSPLIEAITHDGPLTEADLSRPIPCRLRMREARAWPKLESAAPDPSFGPEGMPLPPRWASLALLLILTAYAGLLLYVLAIAAIKLLAVWQWTIAAALVAAAAVFVLHHLLYGRRGC